MLDHIDRAAFLKRVGGLFAVALIDRGPLRLTPMVMSELHHPDPRPGVNADHVLSAEDLGSLATKRGVMAAYDAARDRPAMFDGLACGCGCTGKGGEHRSLLACYESKQPTGCPSCRDEAIFVAGLAKQDKSLSEIRLA